MKIERKQSGQQGPDNINEKIGIESQIIDPEVAWDESFLVLFSPDDAENPRNWSKKVKSGITMAVSGTASSASWFQR